MIHQGLGLFFGFAQELFSGSAQELFSEMVSLLRFFIETLLLEQQIVVTLVLACWEDSILDPIT